MRLNLFKYHAQDRNYSKAEVLSLINNESNKHLTLSGSDWTYSTGATLEATSYVVGPIIAAAAIGIAVISCINNSSSYENHNDHSNGDNTTIINNYYGDNAPIQEYKLSDIPCNSYSGKEVTQFLNKYYNYEVHFNKNVHYNNIINEFLDHDYKDAIIPTLGKCGWFDIAVLDTYNN